jgi:hypothetical protein
MRDIAIAVILGIAARYGIPYIKSLLSAKKLELAASFIQKAVEAAEQKIKGSKMGEEKKEWVLSLVRGAGIIAVETAEALLEAAVKAMNDAALLTQKAASDASDMLAEQKKG